MPKYEYKLSDSLDEVLDWLGEKDRKLVTIMTGTNSYGPFFTAVVEKPHIGRPFADKEKKPDGKK